MQRCVQLAQNGLGTTYPNPLVGSVLVYEGKIIGEGWHQKAGGPHAEVVAINAVKNKSLLAKATLYVSLEPCSHFGKTPPCSNLIIEKQIPKVVIGTVDPNLQVAGKGIEKLQKAGIEVTLGILQKECNELNKRFFTFHQKKRPYILLKWAQSQDGFLAPMNEQRTENQPFWISNSYSKQRVHKWRTEEQAILVGTQTVLDDNPQLNSREWWGNNPLRVALDRTHKIPAQAHLLDKQIPTLIVTEKDSTREYENLNYEKIPFDENLAESICNVLYQKGIQSVIVEGGAQTLNTFIAKGLWDEARIITGSQTFGNGITAPKVSGIYLSKTKLESDELQIIRNYD